MKRSWWGWLPVGLMAGLLVGAGGQTTIAPSAIAQVPLSACPPPQPSEYLLLVVTRTPDTQAQVRQLLPPNAAIATCRYLADTVTRVGGFRTIERANAWARYLTETTGLAAFVARPAESSSPAISPPTASPPDAPTLPTAQPPAIATGQAPKPLGAGYAVLVNYNNQPEIATQLKQALGQPIGLVSYGQSPFLLALYTTDATAAYDTLKSLSDRGFLATLVDSRRVMVVKNPIAL